MADLPSFLVVCEFLWCGDEEVAMGTEIEEDFVFFSALRLFMRREISRIRGYFEVTVPVYELDVFRSHFRMTRTTFELLVQMIILSEYIPNGGVESRVEDSSLLSSVVLASSRWFVDAEDTVATGIILGLSPKQSDNSS